MLRPLLKSDKAIIDEWIARDADHSAKHMTEEFFREQNSLAFAIDDNRGPVMYVRINPMPGEVARLHIQFDEGQHRRTAVALAREFPAVRARIEKANLRYILFDSASEPLVRFCQKHFHFIRIADSNFYILDLRKAAEQTSCA